MKFKSILVTIIGVCSFSIGYSQTNDASELAKKLANPIANMISVPFQNNMDFGVSNGLGNRYTLNFQPVIPVSVNENFNLITRTIIPIVYQNNLTKWGESQNGISDVTISAFLSPKKNTNGLTWGAGPIILLPTGSEKYLTANKFGLGPSVVLLKQHHKMTIGALANQIWSFTGSQTSSNVSQFFLQPFFTYNWKSGAGLGANMEYSQNWVSNSHSIWLNPTLSGITSLGTQKVQLAIGPRFNLAATNGMKTDFGIRGSIVLLFVK